MMRPWLPWIAVLLIAFLGMGFRSADRAQAAVFLKGTFPDVPFSHPNEDAIAYLIKKGIVSGYPDGTFQPERAINRAEFTKIVIGSRFSLLAIDGCLPSIPPALLFSRSLVFSDVARHQWFAKYACKAKVSGIVGGYPDGTFRPAVDINFAEAAKILAHSFYPSVIAPADTSPSVWFEPFVRVLEYGRAIPPSIKSFDQILTRGEMAEMAYRLHADIRHLPSPAYDELASPSPPRE